MGAFLLIKKNNMSHIEEIEKAFAKSLDVFSKKGLSLYKRLVRNEFVIYLYKKYMYDVDNLYEYNDKDFVVSTGTCIYNSQTGLKALREIYRESSDIKDVFSKINGNFCVIIYRNNELYIANDYSGIYHVYCNNDRSVISSSFLALFKSLDRKTLSTQEVYEYVLTGGFYGDKTLFTEIEMLNSQKILQLLPAQKNMTKNIRKNYFDKGCSYQDIISSVSKNLLDYFSTLKANFSNSICAALSGGRDTRLMLALMRQVGIKPYLYVYGDENSINVKIARMITEGEGIDLSVINKNDLQMCDPSNYRGIVENQFYINDGLGFTGSFRNGADLFTVLDRAKMAKLQLNGMAGEIYRDRWLLPDRKLSIQTFLHYKFDYGDFSVCSDSFNKYIYHTHLEDKVKYVLNITQKKVDRKLIDLLFPFFTSRYWAGKTCSINNQISYALMPYLEPRFVFQASCIPIKYKNYGVFNGDLIKFIDPPLAKYPSQYGFNFYEKIKFSEKVKRYVMMHTPGYVRPFLRKTIKAFANKNSSLPYYLSENYLREIIDINNLEMMQYIKIDKIKSPYMLSRAYSVESLIKGLL